MWKPIDTEFFHQYCPVTIADCGGVGNDAKVLRSLLENIGAIVHLHPIGTPGDFLKVIAQGDQVAPYLIICVHGDNDGLVFGEYSSNIDTSMLVNHCLSPTCIAQHINLPGCVVVNTACGGGEEGMAQAFMKGGLKAYIGHIWPSPNAISSPLFIAHFFYKIFLTKCSVREAWEHAASYDDLSRKYVMYDKDGVHSI